MRAAVLRSAGVPECADINPPVEIGRARLIDVMLAGINPIDIQLAAESKGPFPLVVGREGVGTLDGRRVYFSAAPGPSGSMAETSLAEPERCFAIPDALESASAIALGIAGMTAWLSLSARAQLQRGETVLILGAGGAVGSIAIQVAREMGAGRIVAAARSASALARAPQLGADAVVDLSASDDVELLAKSIREACAGQLDVVLDPIWGIPALAALKAASRGGRLIQIGHSAAQTVNLAPAFMRGNATSILGCSSGVETASLRADTYRHLCNLAVEGRLVTETEVRPLSEVEGIWGRRRPVAGQKLCLDPKR